MNSATVAMARAAASLVAAAAALACLASPVAGQSCYSATAWPNPSCPVLGWSACIAMPGCLWNGTSIYWGSCSGSPACTYQTLPGVCKSLLTCSWQRAAWPADTTLCGGDGTDVENPTCKMFERNACVMAPGCNWQGTNVFGGWCAGGAQCTFQASPVTCALTPGCAWTPATATVPVPPPPTEQICRGDGTAFQNPTCPLLSKTACIFTPGCNWKGQSVYSGWCVGGPQCTYLPTSYTCAVTPGCAWTPSSPAP